MKQVKKEKEKKGKGKKKRKGKKKESEKEGREEEGCEEALILPPISMGVPATSAPLVFCVWPSLIVGSGRTAERLGGSSDGLPLGLVRRTFSRVGISG